MRERKQPKHKRRLWRRKAGSSYRYMLHGYTMTNRQFLQALKTSDKTDQRSA